MVVFQFDENSMETEDLPGARRFSTLKFSELERQPSRMVDIPEDEGRTILVNYQNVDHEVWSPLLLRHVPYDLSS